MPNTYLKKIDNYFLHCNKLLLVFIPIIIAITLSLLFAYILSLIYVDDDIVELLDYEKNKIKFFINLVFIAPIIETLLFQVIPFYILTKLIKNRYLIVLIVGILFGLVHYFNEQNYLEVLILSFIGIIYSYFFYIGSIRKQVSPFFIVALIHSGYNLFVFFIK